jgi:AcrR family transcriptional regulator
MLLHYFGSKEALISEAMEQIQAGLQANFQELRTRSPRGRPENLLRDFWKIVSAGSNRAAFRLLFEIQMLALQNPKR